MSLLSDIGGLTGSSFLENIGNTALGQKYSDKILSSIDKKLTPKPAPQVVAAPVATQAVSVSVPDQGMTKKILMIAGGLVGLLTVVYFVKKKR